jgi:hypothetical protein
MFGVKILEFFEVDPGSRMEKIQIRDKHPGSQMSATDKKAGSGYGAESGSCSGSESIYRSVCQWYGSADPDLFYNVTDPTHWP